MSLNNKAIELWQETNKQLARIAAALEKPVAATPLAQAPSCTGKAKGHNWELVDERSPYMGYRCTRCGIQAFA